MWQIPLPQVDPSAQEPLLSCVCVGQGKYCCPLLASSGSELYKQTWPGGNQRGPRTPGNEQETYELRPHYMQLRNPISDVQMSLELQGS